MRRVGLLGVAVIAMTVTACSGNDGEAVDTTATPMTDTPDTTPATTEPTATTQPPPPTTDPPTTTSSTTTSSPASSTSTAPSPTEAAVAAFNALKQAARRCIADLQNCDAKQAYSPYIGGGQLASAIAQIEAAQERGQVARNTDSMTETIEDVRADADDPTRVDIQFCAEDGVVLVIPTASGESLVTDRFVSNRLIARLQLDTDGRWRVYEYEQLSDLVIGEENSICD